MIREIIPYGGFRDIVQLKTNKSEHILPIMEKTHVWNQKEVNWCKIQQQDHSNSTQDKNKQ